MKKISVEDIRKVFKLREESIKHIDHNYVMAKINTKLEVYKFFVCECEV